MTRNFIIDPIYEFRHELMAIQSDFYREIAKEALKKAPDYFFYVPASSSGKYHPKSSLGIGGLVRHVKAVFAISEELLQHPLYAPFTEDEKDEIRVAIILHDCCKQGTQNEPSRTLTEHPLLVRNNLAPRDLIEQDRTGKVLEAWSRICDLIETHMGIWTKDKETGKEVLKVPETMAQLFVHLCDYLASRKIIEVDITEREPQSKDYNKQDKEPAWRKEPATDDQINYVKRLMIMCIEKNIKSPVDNIQLTDEDGNRIYTKGQASDDIEALRKALGFQ
jgi:hypothetical protein